VPTRPEPPVYRVAEIDREVKFLLEDAYRDLWIEGELSNVKTVPAGHVYFRLVDSKEKASIDGVMFASAVRRTRPKLADGQRVRCRGQLSLFEPQGRFQVIASRIEPAGLGELLAKIRALQEKLAAEGLFDDARKRPLPLLPRTIGVVTSREGAAIRDVIEVAHRRFPIRILLAHAAVQGDGAPLEIVWGIKVLERHPDVDVVLVTRGGGSVEDLMAFNDERVVRAIAGCRLPVVSAVGHEIDVTLADLAADRRAPTPSAAAEILVPERDALAAALAVLSDRLERAMEDVVSHARRAIEGLALEDPGRAIATHRQALDLLVARAERTTRRRLADARARSVSSDRRLAALHPRARLAADRARLDRAALSIRQAVRAEVAARLARVDRARSSLGALSPVAVLARGYSITLHGPSGRAVRDPAAAASGDPLEIVVEKGRLKARVE
jgi:exodeoxyribonuclease VII large subunit